MEPPPNPDSMDSMDVDGLSPSQGQAFSSGDATSIDEDTKENVQSRASDDATEEGWAKGKRAPGNDASTAGSSLRGRKVAAASPAAAAAGGVVTYQGMALALFDVRADLAVAQFAKPAPLPSADDQTLRTKTCQGASGHTGAKVARDVERTNAGGPSPARAVGVPKEIAGLLQAALALDGGLEGTSSVVADETLRCKAMFTVFLFTVLVALLEMMDADGIDVETLTPEKATTYVPDAKFKLPFDRIKERLLALDVEGAFDAAARRIIAAASRAAAGSGAVAAENWADDTALHVLVHLEVALRAAAPVEEMRQAVWAKIKREDARAGDAPPPPPAAAGAKRDRDGGVRAPDGDAMEEDDVVAAAAAAAAGPSSSSAPPPPSSPATSPPPAPAAPPPPASAAPPPPSSAAPPPADPAIPGVGGECDLLLARLGGVEAGHAALFKKGHGVLLAKLAEFLAQNPAATAEANDLADLALSLTVGKLAGYLGGVLCESIAQSSGLPLCLAAKFCSDGRPTGPLLVPPYAQKIASLTLELNRDVAHASAQLLPASLKPFIAQWGPRSDADADDAAATVVKGVQDIHVAIPADAVPMALGALAAGPNQAAREGVVRLAQCAASRLCVALKILVIGRYVDAGAAWGAFNPKTLRTGLQNSAAIFDPADAPVVEAASAKVVKTFFGVASPAVRTALGVPGPGQTLANPDPLVLQSVYTGRTIGDTVPAGALLELVGQHGPVLAHGLDRALSAAAAAAVGRGPLAFLPAAPSGVLTRVATMDLAALTTFVAAAVKAVMDRSIGADLGAVVREYGALAPAGQNADDVETYRDAAVRTFDALRKTPGVVADAAALYGIVCAGGPFMRTALCAAIVLTCPIAPAAVRLPSIPPRGAGVDPSAGTYFGHGKAGVAVRDSLTDRTTDQITVHVPLESGGRQCRVGRLPQPFYAVARFSGETSTGLPVRLLCLSAELFYTLLAGPQSLGAVHKLGDTPLRDASEPPPAFPLDLLPRAAAAARAVADVPFDDSGAALRARLMADPASAPLLELGHVPDAELGVVVRALTAVRDRAALTEAVGPLVDAFLATDDGRALVAKDAGVKDGARARAPCRRWSSTCTTS